MVPLGWQIATRPCADAAQLGSASILKRSSNPLWRRFRRWTQSYLESNMSPRSPNSENAELMGSDEDSTRNNINIYNFKISQIWIKLGNPSPCAPLKHQIFDTCRAQNLYAKSFQKTSLECWCKIPPKDQCKILWDDRVRWPTLHKISRFKISVLLRVLHCVTQKRSGVTRSCLCCTRRAKLTFTSHACHMEWRIYDAPDQGKPRSLQVDPINPCHAKQREHSCRGNAQSMQSRAVEPHWPLRPHPAYTSRNTATALFRELFCCKIPEKDVTKAWSKVMWNGTDDGSQVANQMRKVVNISRFLTNFWPTRFSPAKFSLTNFSPIQTSRPHTSHPQTSHKQTSIYLKSPQYIYLRSPFLCLYMLCSHHQFFSFSILSKGRWFSSLVVITLFMASQWLQKARSTPPIYAFFVPTGKACPQTLKFTTFPIKTFSPSLRLAFIT